MRSLKGRRGFTLLEMLVAVAILGVIGVAFLSALATGTQSVDTLDNLVEAEGLARSQLENIKNGAYNTDVLCYAAGNCYTTTVTVPANLSVTVTTAQLDFEGTNALQKISVAVSRVGNSRPILSLSTFKLK